MNIRNLRQKFFVRPASFSTDASDSVAATRARQQIIESIEGRLNLRKTFVERVADSVVRMFGTFTFINIHVVFFAGWILVNLGHIPGVEIFDPFPFNLLTMTVSLEAIFLSILVLISQNREGQIADLRQEVDLHINMVAESEITKVIHLIAYLMEHLKVPYENDPELQRMMTPLNVEEIREELERQLRFTKQKPATQDEKNSQDAAAV